MGAIVRAVIGLAAAGCLLSGGLAGAEILPKKIFNLVQLGEKIEDVEKRLGKPDKKTKKSIAYKKKGPGDSLTISHLDGEVRWVTATFMKPTLAKWKKLIADLEALYGKSEGRMRMKNWDAGKFTISLLKRRTGFHLVYHYPKPPKKAAPKKAPKKKKEGKGY